MAPEASGTCFDGHSDCKPWPFAFRRLHVGRAPIEEAITNGIDAMRGWIEAMCAEGPSNPRPDPLRGGMTCWATKTMPCELVAPGRVLVSSFKRLADSATCVCSRPLVTLSGHSRPTGIPFTMPPECRPDRRGDRQPGRSRGRCRPLPTAVATPDREALAVGWGPGICVEFVGALH